MNRILQVIGSLNIGGSQAMIMNLYREIDKNRIQFDFIVDREDEMHFANEIEELGGKIYYIPKISKTNYAQVKKEWDRFFRSHPEYKIMHSHIRSYASLFIPIAKAHGVKTIIHSHSTSNGTGIVSIVKSILQYPLRFQADYFMSCSESAGKWLFGRRILDSPKYHMIPNAINVKDYIVKDEIRAKMRESLGIETSIVYGHVGRFHDAKNHLFLLDIFSQICKLNDNSKLLLVGDGDLRPDIEEKIEKLDLKNKVILTGNRSDVNRLMMSMDCFLFPSKWEGLPVTVVEAQASGMQCLISDTITQDVDISPLIKRLPIDCGTDVWVYESIKCDKCRKDVTESIKNAGFDIKESARWITDFYESIVI